MFETDLQDEEIKKKKRRVLVVLLVLMIGTAGALPFVEVTGTPSAAAPESTPEPPTAAPTNTPQPPTDEPVETAAPTATPKPTATSRPTATSTPIPVPPTATEELPGGAGGGELEASPTPTGAPTDAPTSAPTDTPAPPTLTPEEPGELPVTGASVGRSGRLALGLATFSVGALMLAVGLALHKKETPVATSRPEPITVAAQEQPGQPTDVSSGVSTSVRLALGLLAVALVLAFVAGYALRRTKKR